MGEDHPDEGKVLLIAWEKNSVNDHWKGQGNPAAARCEDCLQRGGGEHAGLDPAPSWGLSTATSTGTEPSPTACCGLGTCAAGGAQTQRGAGAGKRTEGLGARNGFALAGFPLHHRSWSHAAAQHLLDGAVPDFRTSSGSTRSYPAAPQGCVRTQDQQVRSPSPMQRGVCPHRAGGRGQLRGGHTRQPTWRASLAASHPQPLRAPGWEITPPGIF